MGVKEYSVFGERIPGHIRADRVRLVYWVAVMYPDLHDGRTPCGNTRSLASMSAFILVLVSTSRV